MHICRGPRNDEFMQSLDLQADSNAIVGICLHNQLVKQFGWTLSAQVSILILYCLNSLSQSLVILHTFTCFLLQVGYSSMVC